MKFAKKVKLEYFYKLKFNFPESEISRIEFFKDFKGHFAMNLEKILNFVLKTFLSVLWFWRSYCTILLDNLKFICIWVHVHECFSMENALVLREISNSEVKLWVWKNSESYCIADFVLNLAKSYDFSKTFYRILQIFTVGF